MPKTRQSEREAVSKIKLNERYNIISRHISSRHTQKVKQFQDPTHYMDNLFFWPRVKSDISFILRTYR